VKRGIFFILTIIISCTPKAPTVESEGNSLQDQGEIPSYNSESLEEEAKLSPTLENNAPGEILKEDFTREPPQWTIRGGSWEKTTRGFLAMAPESEASLPLTLTKGRILLSVAPAEKAQWGLTLQGAQDYQFRFTPQGEIKVTTGNQEYLSYYQRGARQVLAWEYSEGLVRLIQQNKIIFVLGIPTGSLKGISLFSSSKGTLINSLSVYDDRLVDPNFTIASPPNQLGRLNVKCYRILPHGKTLFYTQQEQEGAVSFRLFPQDSYLFSINNNRQVLWTPFVDSRDILLQPQNDKGAKQALLDQYNRKLQVLDQELYRNRSFSTQDPQDPFYQDYLTVLKDKEALLQSYRFIQESDLEPLPQEGFHWQPIGTVEESEDLQPWLDSSRTDFYRHTVKALLEPYIRNRLREKLNYPQPMEELVMLLLEELDPEQDILLSFWEEWNRQLKEELRDYRSYEPRRFPFYTVIMDRFPLMMELQKRILTRSDLNTRLDAVAIEIQNLSLAYMPPLEIPEAFTLWQRQQDPDGEESLSPRAQDYLERFSAAIDRQEELLQATQEDISLQNELNRITETLDTLIFEGQSLLERTRESDPAEFYLLQDKINQLNLRWDTNLSHIKPITTGTAQGEDFFYNLSLMTDQRAIDFLLKYNTFLEEFLLYRYQAEQGDRAAQQAVQSKEEEFASLVAEENQIRQELTETNHPDSALFDKLATGIKDSFLDAASQL